MRYALIQNGTVVNVILWGGEGDYEAPVECELVEVPDEVSIGWARVDGAFVAPPAPTPEPMPTEDPAVTAAKESAAADLMALGISPENARTIVGLPEVTEP